MIAVVVWFLAVVRDRRGSQAQADGGLSVPTWNTDRSKECTLCVESKKMANHLIGRIESLLTKFEQLYELITASFVANEWCEPKSPYQYGYRTEYYIERVDAGDSCLKELMDAKSRHEEFRAKDGYPIDKSYYNPLVEAIEVLQTRQPVTVEQLRNRLLAGKLEPGDIVLGVQIREEAKATGWKHSHKPIEAEEAELANYREVLNTLKQPQQ